MRRTGALAALACVAVLAAGSAVPNAATGAGHEVRTICSRTQLRQTAGIQAIPGPVLRRGDRVIVVRYAKRRRWAYVVARNGQGWIRSSALCRRGARHRAS
jgi:hypothetical protein